jgi:hypothetical protein
MNRLYDKDFPVPQPERKLEHSAPKCTLRKCGAPGAGKCPFYDPEFNTQAEAGSDEFKCRAGGIHEYSLIKAERDARRDERSDGIYIETLITVTVFCTKCLDITEKSNVVSL